MEIAFSSSFKRAFKKNIAGNASLETEFWERIELFKNNPFEPKLRTHKLSGKLKDLWSFSIEYDLRVIFSFAEQGKVIFVDVGSHKEVY
ncbi:MAG: type II toxin-antitoxin system mRNA interferase toxin, RelE/StbE family [Acidobacteriota bacterium]|nr:type II toxin-antitoxin system mRNA interferase toxin, RelE/StbE family [Acidobacteriota bacterium]